MIQQLTNFPTELKQLTQFVGHKAKIPMNPHTFLAASSTDAASWSTYAQAIQAVEQNNWDGIGIVLAPPLVGIDMDDCIVDGVINDFAKSVIERCASYTEISPSGTGVHILCKGTVPAAIKTTQLEVYQTGRYFTVTGNVVKPYTILRTVDLGFLYEGRKAVKPIAERLLEIEPGNRNNSFTSLAGSLRSRGYDAEAIYGFLKPRAAEVGFDLNELSTICRSVCRYEPRTVVESDSAASIEQFMADSQKVEWICDSLIAKNTLVFIAGLPETGKTWVLMDLAIEAARDKGVWLDRYAVKKSRVLLIDQERFKGETQRRLRALMRAKAMTAADIKDSLFVRSGTTTRIDLQPSFDAFKRELAEIRPDIVMVDSLVTFHTKEESNRKEIQDVMERIKILRNEFGCTFILIHHESKAAYQMSKEGEAANYLDMSGSVAIPAAAETVFNMRRQDAVTSMLYHTKSTLGTKIEPVMIRVEDLTPDKSQIAVRAY